MKALILCGGRGTRLRPLTYKIPKALVPISGKPIVEHQIIELKKYGVNEIVMCTGYKHEMIRKRFGNGSKFGVKIKYTVERRLLGTGGAIRNARRFIDSRFLVLSGDIMFRVNLEKLIKFHQLKGALATLVVHESSHPYDSDLVKLDRSKRVVGFLGKPKPGTPLQSRLTNASIYVFDAGIISKIPDGRSSLEKEVLPRLVKTGKIYGFVTNEYAKDMGTFDRLDSVKSAMRHGRKRGQTYK